MNNISLILQAKFINMFVHYCLRFTLVTSYRDTNQLYHPYSSTCENKMNTIYFYSKLQVIKIWRSTNSKNTIEIS